MGPRPAGAALEQNPRAERTGPPLFCKKSGGPASASGGRRGNDALLGRGQAARRAWLLWKGKPPGLPGSALRGIPRRIAACGPGKRRACERISCGLPYRTTVRLPAATENRPGRRTVGVVIRSGHAAPRTGPPGGRAPRPQGAAVGRTAGSADGASSARKAGLPAARGRYLVVVRMPAWPARKRRSGRPPLRGRADRGGGSADPPQAEQSCGRKGRFLRFDWREKDGAANILLGGIGVREE